MINLRTAKRKTLVKQISFFSVITLVIFWGSMAFSHEEHHGHGNKENGGHHAMPCDRFIPKNEGALPILHPKWKEIKTLTKVFVYTFYRDTTRPDLPVAAMAVTGKIPVGETTRTRLSWQVGDEIMTVRIEEDEMICVKSILGRDKKYDLEGLMKQLEKVATDN